jgi:hypothetical protein
MSAAIDKMIVDHADGLRESVDNCGAAELEAARFQVFRQSAGHVRFRGHLPHVPQIVLHRGAVDEIPQII